MAGSKPKHALIAYCVLAEKLRTPGVGIMQALTPFLAEACRQFSGELFDATKFSDAVAERYGIRIPRLAVLGLTEQLANNGLLTAISNHGNSAVYKYSEENEVLGTEQDNPITEAEIEAVLESFIKYCRTDTTLDSESDISLQEAFFGRLLNLDSMRILVRKEKSIAAKRSADTLVISKPSDAIGKTGKIELHLDFIVSEFLLELRDHNPPGFEQVSNIAFANMAAEAIACFQDPPTADTSLEGLTVYLDSPLLLDMLGVNTEYADYGRELLEAIKTSGAKPAVMDHCIAEAEAAVVAQLNYLRSGINRNSIDWGTSAKPDLLNSLAGNIADRSEKRLGIEVYRDPDTDFLHRRSRATVGDIESEMNRRMQPWGNVEAKGYDRKSVWSMLAIRDTVTPCSRICDSKWLLLTRNTPLVSIANDAWSSWLKGTTKHSISQLEHWAPIAMSDKQFAGYLWARTGGDNGLISRARLLASCSAAVRPRADVKARAYNLVLELSGKDAADDVAALLEDREGARALMRATNGDPEDVTKERMPYIIERVKLAAGEFAAEAVREESKQREAEIRESHAAEIERLRKETEKANAAAGEKIREADRERLQSEQTKQDIILQNKSLQDALDEQKNNEHIRVSRILQEGLKAGSSRYKFLRWLFAFLFGAAAGMIAFLATANPAISAGGTAILCFVGFWFVPELLEKPLCWLSMKRLRAVVKSKDVNIELPDVLPDFRKCKWKAIE